MKILQREGKTTSAIIADFMREFELKLEDFKIDVIDEGSSGFLNLFGGKPAKIQFAIPDVIDYIKDYVSNLLKLMAIEYEDVEISLNGDIYFVTLKEVENAGHIIGKSAKLLDSLQYIINQMLNKKLKQKIRLKLDVNDYRERSNNILTKKIIKISELVKRNGKSATLEPMSSAHRRVVYKHIEKDKQLRTMTIGEGENKRIVIMPQKNNSSPVKKKRISPKPANEEQNNSIE
jgi:spoIIIJ-associated protein